MAEATKNEPTPQELAEKAAVAAMKGAQANMDRVLKRVATLESELHIARNELRAATGYVGEHSHIWPTGGNARKVKDVLADAVARIDRVLA